MYLLWSGLYNAEISEGRVQTFPLGVGMLLVPGFANEVLEKLPKAIQKKIKEESFYHNKEDSDQSTYCELLNGQHI